MKNSQLIKSLIILAITISFVACATPPKGVLSSSADPHQEIEKLSTDINAAQKSNIDVLARSEYKKSYKYLGKARQDLANGKDQEEVINDLRFGRDFLRKAYTTAGNREDNVPGLFGARQNAIQAGATESSELVKELSHIDEDVANIADKINKVNTKDIAKLQARYVELEKKAVIQVQLGRASAQINGARSDKADKRAPNTLRKAQLSLKNAESLIGSNVSNPSGFRQAVARATYDANHLSEVMRTIKSNGKLLTEASALKMVSQRHQISGLKKDLSTSEDETSYVESKLYVNNQALVDKENTLQQRNKELGVAEGSIAMQNAMEKSRQQFSASEAEAYQQGENLLIRLKSINFKTGQSELPTDSQDILGKVSDVAKSLKAKEIMVIGHTDSVGSQKINKELSEQRAISVAKYFRSSGVEGAEVLSEGHGFEDPIASNKSKAGRAQNRRVDIIITPEEATIN